MNRNVITSTSRRLKRPASPRPEHLSVKDERNVQLFSKGTQTGNNCKRAIKLGDFNVVDAKLKTRGKQRE